MKFLRKSRNEGKIFGCMVDENGVASIRLRPAQNGGPKGEKVRIFPMTMDMARKVISDLQGEDGHHLPATNSKKLKKPKTSVARSVEGGHSSVAPGRPREAPSSNSPPDIVQTLANTYTYFFIDI